MQIAIKHSTVHLLHPDSTETAENVGKVFAHDVPLIHARRCKGVGWLIKIEHSKRKKARGEGTTEPGETRKKNRLSFLCFFSKKQRRLKKKATNRRKKNWGKRADEEKKKRRKTERTRA